MIDGVMTATGDTNSITISNVQGVEGVPNITSHIMTKIVGYWDHHFNNPENEPQQKRSLNPNDMDEWDKEYFGEKNLEQKDLFDIILGAYVFLCMLI